MNEFTEAENPPCSVKLDLESAFALADPLCERVFSPAEDAIALATAAEDDLAEGVAEEDDLDKYLAGEEDM